MKRRSCSGPVGSWAIGAGRREFREKKKKRVHSPLNKKKPLGMLKRTGKAEATDGPHSCNGLEGGKLGGYLKN